MPVTLAVVAPFSVVTTAKPIPVVKFMRAISHGGRVTLPDAGISTQKITAVVPKVGTAAVLKNSTKATAAVLLVSVSP